MKAAVFYKVGEPLVVEDVDLAPPKAREVLVKITASGLCHSDIHRLHGHVISALPLVMGHEGAGVVEQVGEAVTSVQPGDHVVISLGPYCGECLQCAAGNFSRCLVRAQTAMAGNLLDGTSRLSLGGRRLNHQSSVSSFAQYAVVHESAAVPVRKDARLDTLALLGCGATSGLAPVFNEARVAPGDRVAVFGCGGLGLNTIQASAVSGATTIIGIDVLDHRLQKAEEFGATHTINSAKTDPVAEIKRITGGGVDYAFEVIGLPQAVLQAIESLDAGGLVLVIGVLAPDAVVSIPWWKLMPRGTQLKSSGFSAARPKADIPRYVDLYMAGKLKFDELVTGHFKLSEINQAVAVMERGEGVRNLIYPD